jgi:hypothetical protein
MLASTKARVYRTSRSATRTVCPASGTRASGSECFVRYTTCRVSCASTNGGRARHGPKSRGELGDTAECRVRGMKDMETSVHTVSLLPCLLRRPQRGVNRMNTLKNRAHTAA